ncbi:MAG TPA: thioesterase domain-containing protein [Candidatus Limnocylindrales bacterium]|nr:thioesterase domain-containing protein [Candidatus Limnocylindrales bacterium]
MSIDTIQARPNTSRWIKSFHGHAAPQTRLFCFHYAGGSATMFRDWPAHLPSHVGVEAVLLPGRDNRMREKPIDRMDLLVEAIVEAMRPRLDRPYALFGYSMGAQVSFNVAHGLAAAGLPPPSTLFVAASPGPSEEREVPAWDKPDEHLVEYLVAMGGTPPKLLNDAGWLELILPTLRADLTAVATCAYAARPPLPMPIHAFGGEQDESASPALMASWRKETTGRFTQTSLPGEHFFITAQLPALLAAVSANLPA